MKARGERVDYGMHVRAGQRRTLAAVEVGRRRRPHDAGRGRGRGARARRGSTARPLHHLCAADDRARTALTEETHAVCPGRVAWLRLDYWSHEARTAHGCADPAAHGHAERFTDTGTSGSTGGPMTAEQRTLIANNKAPGGAP